RAVPPPVGTGGYRWVQRRPARGRRITSPEHGSRRPAHKRARSYVRSVPAMPVHQSAGAGRVSQVPAMRVEVASGARPTYAWKRGARGREGGGNVNQSAAPAPATINRTAMVESSLEALVSCYSHL